MASLGTRFHNLAILLAAGADVDELAGSRVARTFITCEFLRKVDGPPICISVSFQVMADIKEVLKCGSYRCYGEIQDEVEDVRSLFRNYISHPLVKRKMLADSTCKPKIHSLLWFLEGWYQADAYTAPSESDHEGDSIDMEEDKQPPLFLLRNDPTQCGLIISHILAAWEKFEAWAIDPELSIAPAAVLYLVMRARGLVGQWDDMEYVRECLQTLPYDFNMAITYNIKGSNPCCRH